MERQVGSLRSQLEIAQTMVLDEVKKATVEDWITTEFLYSDPWWDTCELGFENLKAVVVTQYKDLDFSFLEKPNLALALDIQEMNWPKPLPMSEAGQFPTTPITDQVPLTPPAA
ncbi:hypothetical protein PanWU01x14_198760 [Parasponia andersonii]|uniref:Uncharacterized protein n=1 Tax=Parasponia andersonii TaxID=3476 RepID=A0A2P5BYW5_PARAD|nr:hypothetical protein PanWU01x14_198760 [Parasponia andersonii]